MNFAQHVLNFINPKLDSEEEFQASLFVLVEFARKCDLTAAEYLYALELAADGRLHTEDGKKVQLFREIDRLKLGEVKAAYIHHKRSDKQYEAGRAKIKAFLSPPDQEPTEEEKKAERLRFYRSEHARLQRDEAVLGTVIFYGLIKKKGMDKISLKYVENVLDRYQPQTFESGLQTSKAGSLLDLPKKVTHDARTFFINSLVRSYFEKNDLKSLTEKEFIQYWETIKNQNQNDTEN